MHAGHTGPYVEQDIQPHQINKEEKRKSDRITNHMESISINKKKTGRAPQDLAGRKYGKLTVLVLTDQTNAQHQRLWRCICDCGKERLCSAHWLKFGWAKSCGCREPYVDITNKRFGRAVALRPTDKRDSDNSIMWECRCDCGNLFYRAPGKLRRGSEKVSCGCLQTDISRENIQRVLHFVDGTAIEKLESQKIPANNKSGVKGVFFSKDRNKWTARIGFQGKQHFIGHFDTVEDAKKARERAEEKIYQPFLQSYYVAAAK